MKFKKMIDAEMLKVELNKRGQRECVAIIEELQGLPLYHCKIRDRAQGCFKDKEYENSLKKVYVDIWIRAKSEKEARKKVKELYVKGEYGYKFKGAYAIYDSNDLDLHGRLAIDVEKEF